MRRHRLHILISKLLTRKKEQKKKKNGNRIILKSHKSNKNGGNITTQLQHKHKYNIIKTYKTGN